MDTGGASEREIRILHVDDEPGFADLAATFLERMNDRFTVVTAANPDDALRLFRDDSFDCFVSDYDMPESNGLELLSDVRELEPEIPFVLFTGKGSEEIASEAISAGVTDYLQKGPGTEQYTVLANRIKNAVETSRARREATKADRRLRTAHDRLTDGVLAVDSDWRFTYVNDEAERMLERSADALLGTTVWTAFPEIKDTPFEDAFRTAMRSQEPVSIEEYYPPKETWFDVRVYPDEDGVSIYARDVTKRKESTEQLEFFEHLVNEIGLGVGVYVADGRFTFVNEAYADLLGTTVEALEGAPIWTINPDLDADGFDEYWRSFDENETRVAEAVHRLDGDGRPVATVTTCTTIDDTRYHFGTVREITERREEERLLRQYETVIEAMDDAVFLLDADGECTYVNQATAARTEFSREELTGDPISQLVELGLVEDETRLGDYRATIEELLDGERENARHAIELTLRGGDSPSVIDVQLSRVEENDGAVVGVVGVGRDISDRRPRGGELSAWTAAMDAATDGIAILSEDGRYVFVNQAHADIYGYDGPEDVLGETWHILYDDELERMHREVMPQIRTSGSWRGEATGQRKDGEQFPTELSLTELADGKLICVVRDVTTRKERERKLEERTRQLQAVLDTVSAAIFMKDTDGEYLLMNQNCRALFDIDGETDVTGVTDYDIVPDDVADEFRADDRRAFETGETIEIEEEIPSVDGVKTYLTRKSPIFDDDGEPYAVCAVATDITDRKEYEEELERQKQRLDEFASVLSHDLRNPLTTAKGYLELVRESDDPDHFEHVEFSLDRMERIITDVLWLARNHDIDGTEPVDLSAAVADAWEVATPEGIDAVLVDDLDGSATAIDADYDRLCRLLENVLRNAVEHGSTSPRSHAREDAVEHGRSRDGTAVSRDDENRQGRFSNRSTSPDSQARQDSAERSSASSRPRADDAVEHGDPDVTVRVEATDRGFAIEDDGPGIAETQRDLVFERGYSTHESGTGFGLHIVREIADAHGWDVGIADGRNGGARFEIDVAHGKTAGTKRE